MAMVMAIYNYYINKPYGAEPDKRAIRKVALEFCMNQNADINECLADETINGVINMLER